MNQIIDLVNLYAPLQTPLVTLLAPLATLDAPPYIPLPAPLTAPKNPSWLG